MMFEGCVMHDRRVNSHAAGACARRHRLCGRCARVQRPIQSRGQSQEGLETRRSISMPRSRFLRYGHRNTRSRQPAQPIHAPRKAIQLPLHSFDEMRRPAEFLIQRPGQLQMRRGRAHGGNVL